VRVSTKHGSLSALSRGRAVADTQVATQMGHAKVETTKNIYGHLFDADRTALLRAMNATASRLYANDGAAEGREDDWLVA
jgi:integrase